MQTAVCALSALPVVALWLAIAQVGMSALARVVVYAVILVPSYVVFALMLIVVSPGVNRVTGTRSPVALDARIAEFGWPLLRWARYMVAGHIVRLLAGTLFRGSPVWTFYLRLDGARLGRRVFVNTLGISDHNLLVLGDDVTIGADVHISGHTVEHGRLRTGTVHVGHHVTIGLGTAVGIDVVIGDGCEVGAMSLIPKHQRLTANSTYLGIPVRRMDDTASPAT